MIEIQTGDIIVLRKKHPCGSDEWEVLRLGADIRLKCRGCGHSIILSRSELNKRTKKIIKN